MFTAYNVTFKRGAEDWIIIVGEIMNTTRKSFTSVTFRIVLFDRRKAIGTGFIKIHNFKTKSTKPFEVLIYGLHYRFIPMITRYDIMMESGY